MILQKPSTSIVLSLGLALAMNACSKSADEAQQPNSAQEAFIRTVQGTSPTEQTAEVQGAPRVELQTAKYDMGVIENDRISEQRMKVFNRGDAPLKISHVSTSCGCTNGEMATSLIAPGAEADLIIRVDPAKIPGFFAEKVLTLHTNDPTNPQPTVHVASHVKPEAEFSPDVLDFGTIALGDGAELSSTIRQAQEPPLDIIGASLGRELPFIEVTYEPIAEDKWTVPGKREYVLTAKVTKDAPVGRYDEWIWVNTNITRYRNVPIKFKGEIVGPYTLEPRSIAVRNVEPGVPVDGVLTISAQKPLKILEVSNTNPAIEVTPQAGEEPNTFLFTLNFPERTPSRANRDEWTIKLDVDGQVLTETVSVVAILSRTN